MASTSDWPRVINLNRSTSHATLRAGVAEACAGDTLIVIRNITDMAVVDKPLIISGCTTYMGAGQMVSFDALNNTSISVVSAGVIIENLLFTTSTAGNGTGIQVQNATNLNVRGCYFSELNKGLSVSDTTGLNITKSEFKNCGVGLMLVNTSATIYHNNFDNNTVQALDDSGLNLWDSGWPYGGNWWSNKTGTDIFSGPFQNITGADGIWDTPSNGITFTDRYPLTERINFSSFLTLPAPVNLTATAGNMTVSLRWNLTDAGDGRPQLIFFEVLRASSGIGPFIPIAYGTSPAFNDTGLTNGVQYTYIVRAINRAGNSPDSIPVSATPYTIPGMVADFTCTGGNGFVQLSWSNANNGGSPILNFVLFKGTTPSSLSYYTYTESTSYNDSGVSNGQTYYYAIIASNVAGQGPWTGPVMCTPMPSYPSAPSNPLSLSAVAGPGFVNISWTPPACEGGSSISNYRIYRGTRSGYEGVLTTVGNVSFFNDTTVSNGTTYYYYVTALNSYGEGRQSPEAYGLPRGPPTEPLNLAVVFTSRSATLTWSFPQSDGGSSISSFRIFRGLSPQSMEQIGEIWYTTYTDSGLTNGVEYYYAVCAVNSVDVGPLCAPVSGIPASGPGMPEHFTANASNNSVLLSWTPPAECGGLPVTGYRIYRGTSEWSLTLINETGNTTSYLDNDLTNGVRYYYRVSALNARGEGTSTQVISAVPCTVPSAPREVAAVAQSGQNPSIRISWSNPTSDGGSSIFNFTVFRGTDVSNLSPVVNTSSWTTNWVDYEIVNGTLYFYAVAAVNTAGTGILSSTVSATAYGYPGAPTNLTAWRDSEGVHLSWTPPLSTGGDNLSGYIVNRTFSLTGAIDSYFIPNESSFLDVVPFGPGFYTYTLAAVNRVGIGPTSEAVRALSVPYAPTNLSVISTSSSLVLN
ncbi:MAG: fibronectin type III domain-containing protein, partial [Thermoplasmata archaeon]